MKGLRPTYKSAFSLLIALQTNRPDEGIETPASYLPLNPTIKLQTNRPDEGIETYNFNNNIYKIK